jgi:DNA-directed RNA polymerase alpha subunit
MFGDLNHISPKRLQFTIKDVDPAYPIAARRIILSEIPNVAFSFDTFDVENRDIQIHENTGVLHNEFLAHRLSLVPLCFEENDINEFDPKKYKFVLKKKNTTPNVITVTTQDIEIFDEKNVKLPDAFRKKIFPPSDITKHYILLTKLKPNLYDTANGEGINIECRASVNIGQTHARWCPAHSSHFPTIDQEAASKVLDEMVQAAGPNASRANIESKFKSLEIARHFKRNRYDEPCEWTFSIESECRMRPTYIFFKALTILMEKLQKFKTNLNDSTNTDVTINQPGHMNNFYQVNIREETDSLVNTLQSLICNNYIRDDVNSGLEYIGYYQPHPLDSLMYLKLKFKEEVKTDESTVKTFLTKAVERIIDQMKGMIKEWIDVSDLANSGIHEVESSLKNLSV